MDPTLQLYMQNCKYILELIMIGLPRKVCLGLTHQAGEEAKTN